MSARLPENITICILAGGQSQRMGRDKSRIVIRGKTLLARVRSIASEASDQVITVRKDTVINCGPLSGVMTGLIRSKTDWTLFLGCDMPLVTNSMLARLASHATGNRRAVFIATERGVGFPFLVRASALQTVEELVANGKRSLQQLANGLDAERVLMPNERLWELFNANTPTELEQLRRQITGFECESRDSS